MGKVMRHTLGASLNIRHNLSSSKGPKPLQLKLLTTYIPKTSAFTLAFSTSQRLRTTRASARTFFTFRHYITPSARKDRKSGSAGMPRPISYAVFCLKKKKLHSSNSFGRFWTSSIRSWRPLRVAIVVYSYIRAVALVLKTITRFFFFNDTPSPNIYTLSLHDALRSPLRLPLVPRNGCGRPGRAPERFLPLDITSLLLHVIFDARFLLRQRSEERRVGKECRYQY